jgi:predicted RNA-binding protein YlxR (DUF448 family)
VTQVSQVTPAPKKSGNVNRDDPIRRCLVSGERLSVSKLIRFVVGPENMIVPDIAAKLPGRGLWVEASKDALELGVQKNLFSRAAKEKVALDPGLVAMVERLLARRCLDYLGLCQRAGQAVVGFEKVQGRLKNKELAALVEASDGKEDGRNKVLRLALGLNQPVRLVGCFTRDELGLAFGRDSVVHAALDQSGLAKKFDAEVLRLAGFRAIYPENWSVEWDKPAS